jgi:hypothetical protein
VRVASGTSTAEPIGLTAWGPGWVPGEEPTGDVEGRLDVEILIRLPKIGEEGDVLGMADQPGGLVIAASGSIIEGGDPEENVQRVAVGAHGAAGRCGWGNKGRHPAKIPGAGGRWHCSRASAIFVN